MQRAGVDDARASNALVTARAYLGTRFRQYHIGESRVLALQLFGLGGRPLTSACIRGRAMISLRIEEELL